jgi:hypothetical protein
MTIILIIIIIIKYSSLMMMVLHAQRASCQTGHCACVMFACMDCFFCTVGFYVHSERYT